MNYLLLILATFASATKAIVCKRIGTTKVSEHRRYTETSFIYLFAALTVFFASFLNGKLYFSTKTFFISLIFAITLFFTQITQMYAMRFGPASVTTLIYSFGFLIPVFYGSFVLGERISYLQIIGIIIAILSLLLITNATTDKKCGIWLCFSLFAAIGSGLNAVIQKFHRSVADEKEIYTLLIFSFIFVSLLSLIISRIIKKPEVKDPPFRLSLNFTLFSGIAIGFLNILNFILAGKIPAVIHFPIYNIGAMIIVTTFARILFKEKLVKKQIVGSVIGMAAILIIGLL